MESKNEVKKAKMNDYYPVCNMFKSFSDAEVNWIVKSEPTIPFVLMKLFSSFVNDATNLTSTERDKQQLHD